MKEKIIDSILEFEEKNKISEREVCGLKYWSLIRTFVLNDLITEIKGLSYLCDAKQKRKKLNLYILKRSIFTKKDFNKDIILITDTRRVLQKDKYESIFTDELEKILSKKYSTITLEEPSWVDKNPIKQSHPTPALTENLKYVDLYEIKALIMKNFFKIFKRKNTNLIKSEIDSLFTLMEKEYNVNLKNIRKQYSDDLIYFITMRKTYTKLIKKINPKCVFIYFRGFKFKALATSILNELNIKVIEVQHGTIVEDDPIARKTFSYENWISKPDYLFAFGEKQVNEKNLIYKNSDIKYVGNLFLEKKLKQEYEYPEEFKKGKKYIIIISQSVIGEYLSEFATKLSKKLERNDEYVIVFKYHPNESGRYYKTLERRNIIQIKDSKKEIYQYQKYAYCQIGIFSTALYEGISFGLPTFVLENPIGTNGTIKMLKYFKKGVYLEKNIDEIIKLLETNLEKPSEDDVELLWKTNAKENFMIELENILNNEGKKAYERV